MIQQVNLYQDIIRQEQGKTILSPWSAGLLAVILLLTGSSVYRLWDLDSLKTQMQQTRQNLDAEQARTADLLAKFPNPKNDSLATTQIEQLQNKVSELAQITPLLTDKNAGAAQGFSRQFQALANQSVPEVWLNKIHLSGPQRIVDIEGSTFKPGKIPYFLQQLQKEPVFQGQTFAKLVMLKSENRPDQTDFKLNTTLETEDGDEHAQ